MHSASTFFTSYSALYQDRRVEAIGIVVSDGDHDEPTFRLLVVDEKGHASLVHADDVDMYGAYDVDDIVADPPPIDIVGIDHVQLSMPPGQEDEARRFYGQVLGLKEVAKPRELAGRGGCWFVGKDAAIHLAPETGFTPHAKAHPALVIRHLRPAREALGAAGVPIEEDDSDLPVRRCYIRDPFGNRIELVDRRDEGFSETPLI
jgi:catechol 2,3-dioxygenase-like lactoylglutathione lyase family enzyme